ncbi:pentapeptide repeat-containing protein [Paenibacillus lignilyticus]|uniref:Pentapeptide repeat-containing protein n=1 Tax=Paenibacillus lignilyticus TaxID=1172615 RepID=A0ABS5CDA7_9BACL|nr:pentapeptide repeat-containing protein [Paenibacillus lignilyticus]
MFTESEYFDEQFKDIQFSKEEVVAVHFYDCTFTNCEFSETVFDECKFTGCTFIHCDLNLMKVANSKFSQVYFMQSKLVGVNWTEAEWPRITVPSLLKFEECTLNHSTFIGVALPQSTIMNCSVKDVDFREADLTKANLRGSDFTESVFGETNLSGADLSHASNYQIDPSQNRIRQAKFMLPEALNLLYCMDIVIDED